MQIRYIISIIILIYSPICTIGAFNALFSAQIAVTFGTYLSAGWINMLFLLPALSKGNQTIAIHMSKEECQDLVKTIKED